MIELTGISKTFRKTRQKGASKYLYTTIFKAVFSREKQPRTTVLKDITLNIKQGERVAFVGRNKSGKTTLMHIISNILRPDKGKIRIKGKVVPIFGLGVGFNNVLSGKENLILNATALGEPYSWVKQNFAAIHEFAEIEDLDMPLKFFSNGMKARLALAIAVFIRSDILILDEVLDGVDVFFKKKALDKIVERAQKNNTTLLVVSHDEEVIRQLCTSAVYLKNGEIMETGGLDIIDKYKNELN